MFRKNKWILVLFIAVILALTGCQAAAATEEAAAEEPKETIKFADTQWQSLWINNEIAMFIVENGYGYPTESVTVTTAVMQQSLVADEMQVIMEVWWANIQDWWDAEREAGTIVELGDVFESSAQGFFVPRYVIEGDPDRGIEAMAPDLKSVSDLPKYKDLFTDPEDPEKGYLVSCVTGWNCAEVIRIKTYAYGLDDTYNIVEPGSSGALDASIAGAYKKGEPIVAYYWEPTWLLGVYDMVLLEEPEYTDECWSEITEISAAGVVDDSLAGNVPESAGCAFENYSIPKAVSAGMAERNPELVEFLDTMFIGTDTLNKISAYMTENEAEVDEAARWYFENYEDQWRSWVPEDVAEKVAEALAE
ncbi:MAG: hypothetical protein JW750_00200 [Anaerolineaceae bacterium]|nr:hypothetical protein [Anaerolineaceae bacterium]